jgi:hypothetical protein
MRKMALLVLAMMAAAMLMLTGCHPACQGHKGINYFAGNGTYVCNDGTADSG